MESFESLANCLYTRDNYKSKLESLLRVLDDMPNGVAIKELDSIDSFYYCNEEFCRVLKLPNDFRPSGRTNTETFGAEKGRYMDEIDQIAMKSEVRHTQYTTLLVDDVNIKFTSFLGYDDNDKRIFLIYLVENMTEKEIERQSDINRQKYFAITQLVGGLAHDINNQLMSISGNVTMAKSCDSMEKQEKYLNNIVNVMENTSRLIKNVLAYTRKAPCNNEVIDIKTVIDKVIKEFDECCEKNINIQYSCEKNIHVICNDVMLENSIRNLIDNSYDAVCEGGNILVNVRSEKISEIKLNTGDVVKDGKYAIIEVSDDGRGIEEKYLNNIFEPYFTTKDKSMGRGLGLSLVYGTVKSCDGYLDVKSQPDKGTSIKLYIPINNMLEITKKDINNITDTSGRVMLVDDNLNALNAEIDMLEALGYDVVGFSKPSDALEFYKNNSNDIEFAVLDVLMPEMSGFTLYENLIDINEKLVVMFISGYSNQAEHEKIINSGLCLLEKPFTENKMSEAICNLYN